MRKIYIPKENNTYCPSNAKTQIKISAKIINNGSYERQTLKSIMPLCNLKAGIKASQHK